MNNFNERQCNGTLNISHKMNPITVPIPCNTVVSELPHVTQVVNGTFYVTKKVPNVIRARFLIHMGPTLKNDKSRNFYGRKL